MSFNPLKDKFCNDTRPHLVLFGLFIVANGLLVYTLYTRQPERYHRFQGWLSSPPAAGNPGEAAVPAQAAAFVPSAAAPAAQAPAAQPFPDTIHFLGMTLTDVRPGAQRRTGRDFAPPDNGVRVVGIFNRSLPYLSGFRRGDIIVSVNRVPVYSVADFQSVVGAPDPSQGLLFDVFRGGRFYFMTIEAGGPPRG